MSPDRNPPAEPARRLMTVELPWRTILRLFVAATLVWCWLQLTGLFLMALVATLLAITLDPPVRALERRGLSRWGASALVVGLLAGCIVAFLVLASTQLSMQGEVVQKQLVESVRGLRDHVPPTWIDPLGLRSPERFIQSYLGLTGIGLAQGLTRALAVFLLATILTLYLLIEGRTTYAWLLAFVPVHRRRKVAMTAEDVQRVIFGYVSGNVATSAFAALFVLVSLTILRVPAAFLLAILAGVCDFVPVLGFAVSGIPAVLLALGVSPAAGITVFALYVLCHMLENYFIAPYVYGDRLRLSNVTILLAFVAGAELAGIVGAIVALPIAAAYPAVERIWLREKLGKDVVAEHAAIEGRGAEEAVKHAGPMGTPATPRSVTSATQR